MVLYPGTRFGKKSVVDMHCEWCYLVLVLGTSILGFHQEFMSWKVDPVSGEVVRWRMIYFLSRQMLKAQIS